MALSKSGTASGGQPLVDVMGSFFHSLREVAGEAVPEGPDRVTLQTPLGSDAASRGSMGSDSTWPRRLREVFLPDPGALRRVSLRARPT